MIPVSGGVQVEGLGRCFSQTVENNRIYLTCPTVHESFVFDCNTGSLSELWGSYKGSYPTVLAKRLPDENRIVFMDIRPGILVPFHEREGYSSDLAKSCYPDVLTTLTSIALNPKKDGADMEKAMAEYIKIRVKRYGSTGEWHFYHDDEEWDFERCLNEICATIHAAGNRSYQFDHTIVLNYFDAHADEIFEE